MKLWIQNGVLKLENPTDIVYTYGPSQLVRYVPNSDGTILYVDTVPSVKSFHINISLLTEYNGGVVPPLSVIEAALDLLLARQVNIEDIDIGNVKVEGSSGDKMTILPDNAAGGTPNVTVMGGQYNATPPIYSDKDVSALQVDMYGNIKTSPVGASAAGGGGNNTYSTMQGDFTVVANNGTKTATITWLRTPVPFTLAAQHIISGSAKLISITGVVSTIPLTTVTVAGLIITFTDLVSNFITTDTVVLTLIGPDKAYNGTDNVSRQSPQSHDLVTHYTPVHGLASYTSASTLTLTGFPVIPDITNCKIVSLSVIPLAGTSVVRYENGINGYYIACSSGVITLYLNGVAVNAFLATDLKYEVRLCIYPRAEDPTNDVLKVSVESQPIPTTSGPDVLLSAAQTLTASAVDVGYEIPTLGCEVIGVWPKITVNAATAITMVVLCKHTAQATNEFSQVTESIDTGVDTITAMTYKIPAANGLYCIPVRLNKVVPYVQIQFLDVTGSTHATVDSLEITKPA